MGEGMMMMMRHSPGTRRIYLFTGGNVHGTVSLREELVWVESAGCNMSVNGPCLILAWRENDFFT
jgi:hypothetical protein